MKLLPEQIESLLDLLEEAHAASNKRINFSRRKAKVSIQRHMDRPKSLILVNKNVTAILMLVVQSTDYSTDDELTIIHSYSKTRGGWFRLFKEAKGWASMWGDSLKGMYMTSTGTDEVNNMLKKFGMKQIGIILSMEDL